MLFNNKQLHDMFFYLLYETVPLSSFTCDRIPWDLILCQKSDNFKWQHWDLNLSLPALKHEFSNGRSPLSFSEIIVSKIYQLLADVVLPKLPLYVLPFNIFEKVNTIKYIDIGLITPEIHKGYVLHISMQKNAIHANGWSTMQF